MGPCYMLSQGGRFRTPPGASRTPPDFFGPLRGATVIHPCSTVANTGESTPGDACSGVRLVVFGNTGGPRSGPPVFFGPLRGAFWAPAARPTWSLGTFCSGFPAPAPPNPDLTNLLDPPNLHTGFYLYLSAYEVLAAGELAPGLAAGELAPGLAAGQLAPGLAAGELAPGLAAGELAPGRAAGKLAPGLAAGKLAPDALRIPSG